MNVKSCPFCGHAPQHEDDYLHPTGSSWRDDSGRRHYMLHDDTRGVHGQCWELGCLEHEGGCGAVVYGDSRQEALDAWSRRPAMTAPRDALAQLEAVLALSEYDVLPVMDHPLSPRNGDGPESAMTEWIAASVKPRHDGPYLRQFDDGDALSWWYEGRWNADSFFAGASDIQDAPWRGFSPSGLFIHQHAETLRALLVAADGGWQPIATAPKDGTRVRLINIGTGVEDVGYWSDSSHIPQEQRDALWPDWFRNPDGTWPDGEWSQDEGNGDMTHWKAMTTLTKAPAND